MVEVRDLSFCHSRDDKHAVRIDCLEISEGQTLVLLGPSGAGKTTTLRLVAGLLRPQHGSLKICGVDVTDLPPERRKIGMVFQQPLLFPFLSVLDNVAFALRAGGQRRSKARDDAQYFLDLVGLGDFATRSVHSLSGGQAQRVALARALAARPKVLLLDEPFSSLDVYVRAEMQDMLTKLRTRIETTMIFVTHDQREAALLADVVALMSEGQIMQYGSIAELYQYPKSMQINQMMGGRNKIRGAVVDGVFHSEIGALALSHDSGISDGTGNLVFRQEAVDLLPLDLLHSHEGVFKGRVLALRTLGARVEVTLETRGPLIIAEVAAPLNAVIGDEFLIRIPIENRWIVKDAHVNIMHKNESTSEMEYV